MTWYVSIRPVQEPFDLGVDTGGRSLVAFNVNVVKGRSNTFYHELFAILAGAGFIPSGRISVSSKAVIPSGDAPSIQITETGGTEPDTIHNAIVPKYPRPNAQILTRAMKYSEARQVAELAYLALAAIRNTDVPPASIP